MTATATAYDILANAFCSACAHSKTERRSAGPLEDAWAKANVILDGLKELRTEAGLYRPGFLGDKPLSFRAEADKHAGFESVWVYTNIQMPGDSGRLHMGCYSNGVVLYNAGPISVEIGDEDMTLWFIRRAAKDAGWKMKNPDALRPEAAVTPTSSPQVLTPA